MFFIGKLMHMTSKQINKDRFSDMDSLEGQKGFERLTLLSIMA